MIYTITRYHYNIPRNRIGFISICPQWIPIHIYEALFRYGFIRGTLDDISLFSEPSYLPNTPSYFVKKRRGMKEVLLQLTPLAPMNSKPVFATSSFWQATNTAAFTGGDLFIYPGRTYTFSVGHNGNNNR